MVDAGLSDFSRIVPVIRKDLFQKDPGLAHGNFLASSTRTGTGTAGTGTGGRRNLLRRHFPRDSCW